MVVLQKDKPDSLKVKMKSYLQRVVYRPGGRKIDKNKSKKNCGYLGDDERAQVIRTFSPPPPRSRPFPLIISTQSEEALHRISTDSSCDMGSAGSSHSSGYNDSMIDDSNPLVSGAGFRPFDVDSPIVSECNYQMRDDERAGHVFEGLAGPEIVETVDTKDQNHLIKSLTHKNKILKQEIQSLEAQLEHQEGIMDKMESDIRGIKREKKDIEKLRKEEGGRMTLENKELEYNLERLREGRLDAANKLELMERERDSNKDKIEVVRLQLQQAIEEHLQQKERNTDLLRQLENKERQLSTLADDYKQDSHLNLAAQYTLDELKKDNQELKCYVEQLKSDKDALAGHLTRVTCELSRLRQGVPLSPNSTNSSMTSPIVNYHSLPPVFEEGDNLDDLLNNKEIETASPSDCTLDVLEEIEHGGYIHVSEILSERDRLIQKNEMLEQELDDMKKLMYVVAPQHYIDDDAFTNDHHVQYTKPTEIQYECISSASTLKDIISKEMNLTPSMEEDDMFGCASSTTTLSGIPDLLETSASSTPEVPEVEEAVEEECHHHPESRFREPSDQSPSEGSRDPSDDADSGVLCQSSTDLGDHGCESCVLWHPEKEMLIKQVVKSELDLENVRNERERLEYELSQLQPTRWRGWLLHFTALLILLTLACFCLTPLFSHQKCRPNSHVSWAETLSYRVVHLRDRSYHVPH